MPPKLQVNRLQSEKQHQKQTFCGWHGIMYDFDNSSLERAGGARAPWGVQKLESDWRCACRIMGLELEDLGIPYVV
jgi:hypothetical protein